jgi:hypothetical protein
MTETPARLSGLVDEPSFTPQQEAGPGLNELAPEIVDLLPDHETYIEPYASHGTLLGVKPESRNEVVNDIHGDLLHLYETIRDDVDELVRFLGENQITTDLREEWEKTFLRGYRHTDDIVRAGQFFVQFATPVSVTGSVYDDLETIREDLLQFRQRFDDVLIECKPPHELMSDFTDDSVCMFLNPPFDAERYEYGQRDCDIRFMRDLMEWQGGGVDGEPYWALLTKTAPSPISMLATTELEGNTLTRNYSMGLPHVTPFLDAQTTPDSLTSLSAFTGGSR